MSSPLLRLLVQLLRNDSIMDMAARQEVCGLRQWHYHHQQQLSTQTSAAVPTASANRL